MRLVECVQVVIGDVHHVADAGRVGGTVHAGGVIQHHIDQRSRGIKETITTGRDTGAGAAVRTAVAVESIDKSALGVSRGTGTVDQPASGGGGQNARAHVIDEIAFGGHGDRSAAVPARNDGVQSDIAGGARGFDGDSVTNHGGIGGK